jgi:signal transduction histidine kinase
MTGLLLETSLSAEQRSYAGAVDTSARSLLSIIDELLDVARADAGELTISTEARSIFTMMSNPSLSCLPLALTPRASR